MTKAKKTSVFMTVLAVIMVAIFGIMLVGCGEDKINQIEDDTIVHSATVTSWWDYTVDARGLDTSVNINFDNLDIQDIDRITFEIYDEEALLGNAISEGDNLTNLLKECAQYWDASEDTYLEVKGDRILSCAFLTLDEETDDEMWVRSACSLTEPELPTKLVVKVLAGNNEYISTYENA